MQTRHSRRVRLTRRGRIAITVTGAAAAACTLALVLPLMFSKESEQEPRTLTIPEGWRSGQVYEAVDKVLRAPRGTAKKSLTKAELRLPEESGGNPEGYLFPATYPITEQSTPRMLLSVMVDTANKKFGGPPVTAGAESNAMNVYQTVIIASIVQAEAATESDMGRVARIIYNRIDRGMPLQMDSTINYALNRSTVRTSEKETSLNNPYNTYNRMGLPPTPISNPGEQALRAAIDPTPGDWLYFVTVKPGDTRFTASYEEQLKNVAEFNHNHRTPVAGS